MIFGKGKSTHAYKHRDTQTHTHVHMVTVKGDDYVGLSMVIIS